jgi:hypothetical protein
VARWLSAPFPLPAHQTGRAVFPHPAFGQGILIAWFTPLPTNGRDASSFGVDTNATTNATGQANERISSFKIDKPEQTPQDRQTTAFLASRTRFWTCIERCPRCEDRHVLKLIRDRPRNAHGIHSAESRCRMPFRGGPAPPRPPSNRLTGREILGRRSLDRLQRARRRSIRP